MTRVKRLAVWLNTGDNSFNVICLCCAPLLALVVAGMAGGGAS